jgi:hypothetical protein
MTSIIKVNTIQDVGGNNLLISNGSGTITTNNIGGENTPAFYAYLSSSQSISANTATKASIDTELFDSNNNYDNSSNYRYTPTVAGKYYVFAQLDLASNSASTYKEGWVQIRKNGSSVAQSVMDMRNGYGFESFVNVNIVVDMNGSSDYLEVWGLMDDTGGTTRFYVRQQSNYFGAYRLIGA